LLLNKFGNEGGNKAHVSHVASVDGRHGWVGVLNELPIMMISRPTLKCDVRVGSDLRWAMSQVRTRKNAKQDALLAFYYLSTRKHKEQWVRANSQSLPFQDKSLNYKHGAVCTRKLMKF
jgi:hypothetical protein